MNRPLVAQNPDDNRAPRAMKVAETISCEILLDMYGFYVRCTADNCTYVSYYTPSKSVAREWANAHDEDKPNDGRAN